MPAHSLSSPGGNKYKSLFAEKRTGCGHHSGKDKFYNKHAVYNLLVYRKIKTPFSFPKNIMMFFRKHGDVSVKR